MSDVPTDGRCELRSVYDSVPGLSMHLRSDEEPGSIQQPSMAFLSDPYQQEPVTRSVHGMFSPEESYPKPGSAFLGTGYDSHFYGGKFNGDSFSTKCPDSFGGKSSVDDSSFEPDDGGPMQDVWLSLDDPEAPKAIVLEDDIEQHSSTLPLVSAPAVFKKGDQAPRLSDQPLIGLEVTSFEVSTGDVHNLGNGVQRFFLEICRTVPIKVSREKFTVKAMVSAGFESGVVEAQIFEVAPSTFVVELSRRSGDALLRVAVYRRLQAYLKDQGFDTKPWKN